MRIIGLDPGLRVTGWGVVDISGNHISHVANGSCRSSGLSLPVRLLALFDQLSEVVESCAPDSAAVEKVFVNMDNTASLKLGHARAMSLLVAARAGIQVSEYAPNSVKKAVVGQGHADKKQVQHMVRMQLGGAKINGPDASDALAVALTHAFLGRHSGNLERAVAQAEQ